MDIDGLIYLLNTLGVLSGTIPKSFALMGGNDTDKFGSIPFQHGVNSTAFVHPNRNAKRSFLSQLGNGVRAYPPSFDILHITDIPDLSGKYILRSLLNANTILGAIDDNTPVALTVAEQRLVGRITGGNIVGLTGAQVLTLLGITNPMTTLGDIIYENATPVPDRLAGDTSNTRKFLRTLSVMGVAQAPVWDGIVQNDVDGLKTIDSPSFFGLSAGSATIGSLAGLLFGTAGVVSAKNAADSLTFLGIGQAWITPAFNAADFTASGSMTWTVEAGGVNTYAYTIFGKTMIIAFIIIGAIGGTLNNSLYIKIPASKAAAKKFLSTAVYIQNAGGVYLGYIYTESSWTTIKIAKPDNSNFATDAGMVIYGQIPLEIN